MKHVTVYLAKTQPANTVPVRYWRLIGLGKGREIALTRPEQEFSKKV